MKTRAEAENFERLFTPSNAVKGAPYLATQATAAIREP
jgi:hypothetical protein